MVADNVTEAPVSITNTELNYYPIFNQTWPGIKESCDCTNGDAEADSIESQVDNFYYLNKHKYQLFFTNGLCSNDSISM